MSVSDWREVRIGEVISFNPSESLKKGEIAKKIAMEQLEPFTRKIANYELSKFTGGSKFRNGDTLFARITPCLENGKTAYVNILDDNEVAFGSTEFIVMRKKEKITDDMFVYYLAISPDFRNKAIQSMTGTSGRQRVQQDVLQSHKIMLPPLHEQKAIAATLSALDDMIELNNQINKTLEEMAQAIFKSWFVDFEPFKDGEFEESELGLIPKGWRVVELGEITEEIRERVKDRKIPVFSAVKTGDLVLSEDYFTKQVFSRDISKYIVVKPFDFAYNPARINIGSIGINEFSYTGCVSPVYVVFRTDQKYKWFFKMLTRTERFKKEVNTRASGSVRQTLNFDEFSKIKVVYPYAEIVEEYNYIFEGLIMAKSKIEEEISILSEIRDTLLPKLMSGEIRVPVEEVV